jgi:hypothetical protein
VGVGDSRNKGKADSAGGVLVTAFKAEGIKIGLIANPSVARAGDLR